MSHIRFDYSNALQFFAMLSKSPITPFMSKQEREMIT